MSPISRGVRNAFRNATRTISIVTILGLSIGLSLAMLIAHQAVGQKIDSVKASVGNTVSIAPAGVRGFEGGGNPLTQTQIDSVKALPHVVSIKESLSDRLTSSNSSLKSAIDAGSLGRRFAENDGSGSPNLSGAAPGQSGSFVNFTPPVTVTGTTDPTDLSSGIGAGQGGTFILKSGKLFGSTASSSVALVGSSIAAKNNLKTGSTFTAYNTPITVAGIFDAGNTFSNNQVVMPLATVQKLSDQPGDLTSVTLTIDSINNVGNVTTTVKKTLGSAADVTNAAQQAKSSIAPLQNIQTISLYSLVGAVIAGAAIILLTMVMVVRERRREIGVIKAIGARNSVIMGQFATEAITLTGLGAVVGIILGGIAGQPITHLLVSNASNGGSTSTPGNFGNFRGGGRGFGGLQNNISNIHAAVGWGIIIDGLVAALIIALVGSALASFAISKIRPAEVMRTE